MTPVTELNALAWLPIDTLHGHVALLLGSARQNKELLDELLTAGARVVVTGPSNSVAMHTPLGVHVLAAVDSTSPEALARLFDEVEQQVGAVSILIHGAGDDPADRADRWSAQQLRASLSDGLDSLFFAAAELARRCMKSARPGVILGLLARHGREEGQVASAAVEGAVDNLIKTLAVEWARDGIRANAIVPGMGQDSTARRRQLARASLYLCSDYAAYITGHLLVMDIEQTPRT